MPAIIRSRAIVKSRCHISATVSPARAAINSLAVSRTPCSANSPRTVPIASR